MRVQKQVNSFVTLSTHIHTHTHDIKDTFIKYYICVVVVTNFMMVVSQYSVNETFSLVKRLNSCRAKFKSDTPEIDPFCALFSQYKIRRGYFDQILKQFHLPHTQHLIGHSTRIIFTYAIRRPRRCRRVYTPEQFCGFSCLFTVYLRLAGGSKHDTANMIRLSQMRFILIFTFIFYGCGSFLACVCVVEGFVKNFKHFFLYPLFEYLFFYTNENISLILRI